MGGCRAQSPLLKLGGGWPFRLSEHKANRQSRPPGTGSSDSHHGSQQVHWPFYRKWALAGQLSRVLLGHCLNSWGCGAGSAEAQQGILFALTCVREDTQALVFHEFIPERHATSKVTLDDNKLKMCGWNGVPGGPYSVQQRYEYMSWSYEMSWQVWGRWRSEMGPCLLQSQRRLTGGFEPFLASRYTSIPHNHISTAGGDSFRDPGVGRHQPCPLLPCLSLLSSDLLSFPALLRFSSSTNPD